MASSLDYQSLETFIKHTLSSLSNLGKEPLAYGTEYVLQNSNREPYTSGYFVEFGVYSGRTINIIAERIKPRVVYGFDCFDGLPEDWRPEFRKGAFATRQIPNVHPNAYLVKGYFDVSIPIFRTSVLKDSELALVHVDCDLYSSTKTIFSELKKNIVPGTMICFDELIGYPNYENHEIKALYEFILDSDFFIRVHGTCAQFNGNANHQNSEMQRVLIEITPRTELLPVLSRDISRKLAVPANFLYPVVVLIPFGRKDTVSILKRYIDHYAPLFSEIVFWKNTSNESDLEYLKTLEEEKNPKYRFYHEEKGGLSGVYRMYNNFREKNTLYLKIDDDIVYLDNIQDLLNFAVKERNKYSIYSANVINSLNLPHMHQRIGAYPPEPFIKYPGPHHPELFDSNLVHDLHKNFLQLASRNELDLFRGFDRFVFIQRERMNINCFCYWGEDITDEELRGLNHEDEAHFSHVFRAIQGRYPVVVGKTLAVHYSFRTQKALKWGEYINEYKILSEKIL